MALLCLLSDQTRLSFALLTVEQLTNTYAHKACITIHDMNIGFYAEITPVKLSTMQRRKNNTQRPKWNSAERCKLNELNLRRNMWLAVQHIGCIKVKFIRNGGAIAEKVRKGFWTRFRTAASGRQIRRNALDKACTGAGFAGLDNASAAIEAMLLVSRSDFAGI